MLGFLIYFITLDFLYYLKFWLFFLYFIALTFLLYLTLLAFFYHNLYFGFLNIGFLHVSFYTLAFYMLYVAFCEYNPIRSYFLSTIYLLNLCYSVVNSQRLLVVKKLLWNVCNKAFWCKNKIISIILKFKIRKFNNNFSAIIFL